MKPILSLMGGAITLTESAGVFTLTFNESLGGGQAAGVITGSGSIVLNANTALALGESLLNSHLPASLQPMASVVESVVNSSLRAME